METFSTLTYDRDGRVARITLNRPERGNAITPEMARELGECVERANLDPEVHAIALAGNGRGFCGGYDLAAAEGRTVEQMPPESSPDASASGSAGRPVASAPSEGSAQGRAPAGSPLDLETIAANHDPDRVWDPVVDF